MSGSRAVIVVVLAWGCSTPREELARGDAGTSGGVSATGGVTGAPPGNGGAAIDAPVDRPTPMSDLPAAETPAVDSAPVDAMSPMTASPARNGTPCSAGDQCTSGMCVDGVCCNFSCGLPCSSCRVAGQAGTCLNVFNDHDGRACIGADLICLTADRCATVDQKTAGPGTCTRAFNAVAQGFTVGRSGRLGGVRVELGNCKSSFFYLSLHDVQGTTLVDRMMTTFSSANELKQQVDKRPMFLFGQPIPVTAGQKLAFSFTGACDYRLHCGAPAAYADGISWSGQLLDPEGISWTPQPQDDLVFETLMLP
jgi:hypothetical protein